MRYACCGGIIECVYAETLGDMFDGFACAQCYEIYEKSPSRTLLGGEIFYEGFDELTGCITYCPDK